MCKNVGALKVLILYVYIDLCVCVCVCVCVYRGILRKLMQIEV